MVLSLKTPKWEIYITLGFQQIKTEFLSNLNKHNELAGKRKLNSAESYSITVLLSSQDCLVHGTTQWLKVESGVSQWAKSLWDALSCEHPQLAPLSCRAGSPGTAEPQLIHPVTHGRTLGCFQYWSIESQTYTRLFVKRTFHFSMIITQVIW